MIETLKWGAGKRITIYSDLAYGVGALLVELPQWLRAGFLTAGGKPIKHQAQTEELAKAVKVWCHTGMTGQNCWNFRMTGQTSSRILSHLSRIVCHGV